MPRVVLRRSFNSYANISIRRLFVWYAYRQGDWSFGDESSFNPAEIVVAAETPTYSILLLKADATVVRWAARRKDL